MWEMRPTRQNTSGVVVGRGPPSHTHNQHGGYVKNFRKKILQGSNTKFGEKKFLAHVKNML